MLSFSHLYVDSLQRKSFERLLLLAPLRDQLEELVATFVQLGGVELETEESITIILDLVRGTRHSKN